MRVVYVCLDPGVPVFGQKGASVHVQSVLRSLLSRGAEVHLVTTRPGGAPTADLAAVRVHVVPVPKALTPADREVALQAVDAELPRLLDALAAHERIDIVYERYSLWAAGATAWAREHGVASVLEVNAPLIDEQARHRVLVDHRAAERTATAAFAAAQTVVCVSEPVRHWVLRHGGAPDRVFTVANGVDTTRIRPASHPPSEERFTIGFVGTLKPWHGVDVLLRAVHRLRDEREDCRLLLVGDGPERSSLERLARSLHIDDAVEMTGAVDPDAVPGLLHRMHVAVAPYPATQDFYFSPLKVYEYLAAGLPVVASRIGSLPDALHWGRAGVLVEPGRPEALAEAITRLGDDPDRRARLGRAARASAVRDHDWSRVLDRILSLTGAVDAAV